MNVRSVVALLLAGVSIPCVPDSHRQMSWERAKQLLGRPIEELRAIPDVSVSEDTDYVDEDEATIFTQIWKFSYPEGGSFLLSTDDGIATMVELLTPEIATDRGVRIGDSLAQVKRAYPNSRTFNGSTDTLSTAFRLYAENGNLSFTFRDKAIWEALRKGETFQVDDPRVRDAEVSSIDFADGNRFACGEKSPCPHEPAWITRE